MKLVYEDGEIERIRKSHNEVKDMYSLFQEGNEYSINFKVTDVALAETVLVRLLNNKLPELNIGIDVTSINLEPYISNDVFKEELHRMIDELL